MKKIGLFILIFLIALSIYHDLHRNPTTAIIHEEQHFSEILHIKIKQGDTVLSITNEMNEKITPDIEQVINDFEQLNPGTSPNKLIPNQVYYFPLYNKEG